MSKPMDKLWDALYAAEYDYRYVEATFKTGLYLNPPYTEAERAEAKDKVRKAREAVMHEVWAEGYEDGAGDHGAYDEDADENPVTENPYEKG